MQAKSSTNPFKATPDLWQVSFVTKFSNISKLDLIFEEIAEAISSNEISSSHIEHRPDDLWRYNCFFQAEPSYNEIYNLTASYRIGDLQIIKEDEKDWVLAVQENMKPIYVGGFFIYHKIGLKPIEDNFVPIYINPGRAFGTGEHPTTNLCLQFISECKLDPNYVLDMGCGSGILSFACKKLWPASQIIGVDIDEVALSYARENSLSNNLDIIFTKELEKNTYKNKVDLIVSNILAGPIIEMAEDFAFLINSSFNGQVILSGFLEDQKASVIDKFTQLGFVLLSERSMNGWCCILLNKSSNLESDF